MSVWSSSARAGLGLIGLTYVAAALLAGPVDAAGHLAPLVLFLLPLMLGRCPWEAALVRRRVPPAPGLRLRLPAPPRPRTRALAPVPRGGRLLARSLAGRGPPLGSHP